MLILKKPHLGHRLDNSPLYQIRQISIFLFSAFALHTGCMIFFEKLLPSEAIWLTMTTITTVGYGDLAPKTLEGRVATIILVYFGGIIMLARIGGLYFDYLLERRMKIIRGKWHWKLKNHLVFINAPQDGASEYFKLLVKDLRESTSAFSELPVIIYSNQFKDGLPEALHDLGVAHVHSDSINEDSLKNAAVADAAIIVVIAKNNYDPASDSIAFDMVHRLRSMGATGRIIVEAVHNENKNRLISAGANVVTRPVRGYPELVVRAIVAPGSEMIIEELIKHDGATCRRYDININAHWRELRQLFNDKGWGILIGFIDQNNQQYIGNANEKEIHAKGLLSIVREDEVPQINSVIEELQQLYRTI